MARRVKRANGGQAAGTRDSGYLALYRPIDNFDLRWGLKVMDASAFALCAENKVPMVRVFGLDDPENLIRVLEGSGIGTFVHP